MRRLRDARRALGVNRGRGPRLQRRLPAAAYLTVSRRGSLRGSLRGVVRVPERSANGLFQVRRRVGSRGGVSLSVRRSVRLEIRGHLLRRAPSLVFARVGSGRRGRLPAREGLGSPEPPAAAAPSSGPAPRCCALACCSDIASAWRSRRAMLVGRDRPSTGDLERDDEDGAFAGPWTGRARAFRGSRAPETCRTRARDAPSAAAHRRRPPPSSRRADRVTYQPDLKSSCDDTEWTRAAAHHFSFPLASSARGKRSRVRRHGASTRTPRVRSSRAAMLSGVTIVSKEDAERAREKPSGTRSGTRRRRRRGRIQKTRRRWRRVVVR